ncbi:hypothetical protein HMPREF0262_03358 [Clostridium sp. ATCC 29733]|nr:hypothetical protein HMPREF0262_03358 [Clostridium sp. ATCC 29733]
MCCCRTTIPAGRLPGEENFFVAARADRPQSAQRPGCAPTRAEGTIYWPS